MMWRRSSVKTTASTLICIYSLATLFNSSRRYTQCNAGWVDPDTPEKYLNVQSNFAEDTREYELVFSDEFEQDGRSFEDGSDPRWTAIDKNDYTNEALHFYRPQNVKTTNGVLNISTVIKDNKYKAFNEDKHTYYTDAKHFQTGMVQGWNKFCMTGGIIEFSAKLPGDPKTGGLWPALWMLGNLARATYVGSSNFIWPYSLSECNEKNRHSQTISGCSNVGHFGMKPGLGRGSPEIDILEAMMGNGDKLPATNITRPYFSTSLQVAPGLEGMRPELGHKPKKGKWYKGLEYGSNNTQLNPFFYGVLLEHTPKKTMTYQSDAISANTHITKDFFQHHHKYRVEWEPPHADGKGGYLKWYLDGKFLYGIKGDSLGLSKTEIPSEPMYLLMNTAVASSWGFPKPCPSGCNCKCYECGNPECSCGLPDGFCENLPASFEIDYVRAYQAKSDSKHVLGCSTKARPTAKYIMGHKKDYSNTEAGQKEPLQPIQRGGGYCTKNKDCGHPSKGSCSAGHYCICEANFTGPMCLSHAGFDDNPPQAEDLEVDMLNLTPSGSAMFGFAALAFIVFVGMVVYKKRRQVDGYDRLPSNGNGTVRVMQQQQKQQGAGNMPQGYQQQTAAYNPMGASADAQKTVTYCMIDNRLLDDQ